MTWSTRFLNGRWVRVFVAQRGYQLPRFEFDQQRQTCEACALHEVFKSLSGDAEMACTLNGRRRLSCSAARLPDGVCGPEAREFKARAA